jgi:hypothetical protein
LEVSETEILANFEKYCKILSKVEDPERAAAIKKLLDEQGDRIATTPGHDRSDRHSATPGGMVKRALDTLRNAKEIINMRAFSGAGISLDSIIITCLLHDIGRIGDENGDYYVPQQSSWHREKGNYYTYNPNIRRMTHPHRGLYILQSYGVSLTQDEWTAIATQMGGNHEENRFYNGFETPLSTLLQMAIKLSSMQDFCGPENS